jgi:hypothetical protein
MVDGTTLAKAGTPRELVMDKSGPGSPVKAQPSKLTGGGAFSVTWKSS